MRAAPQYAELQGSVPTARTVVRKMKLSPRSAGALCALALLLSVTGCHRHRKTTSAPNTTDYSDNLEPLVASNHLAFLRWPNISDYQPLVKDLLRRPQLRDRLDTRRQAHSCHPRLHPGLHNLPQRRASIPRTTTARAGTAASRCSRPQRRTPSRSSTSP